MPRPITPLLTADAVILYGKDNIILIKRKNPPYQGHYALPGGFMDVGETIEHACIREVKEETNIDVKIIKMIGVFSDPKRDPRDHTVTIAFLCEPLTDHENPKAQDDAAALEIVPLKDIPNMEIAFDHKEIIYASGLLEK